MEANLSEQLEQVRVRIEAVERSLSSAPPPDHEGTARERSLDRSSRPSATSKDAAHKKLWERLLEPSVLIPALLTALTANLTWYVKEQELEQQQQRFHQDVSRDQLNNYLSADDTKERLAVLGVILGAPATSADMKAWATAEQLKQNLAANEAVELAEERRVQRVDEGLPPKLDQADLDQIESQAQRVAAQQVKQIQLGGASSSAKVPPPDAKVLTPRERARELWSKGYEAFAANDFTKAKDFYTQSLAADGSYAPAINSLGRLALEKKPAESEAQFRKALALRPHYAPADYNLALALSSQGKADEARKQLEIAIKANPDYEKLDAVRKQVVGK